MSTKIGHIIVILFNISKIHMRNWLETVLYKFCYENPQSTLYDGLFLVLYDHALRHPEYTIGSSEGAKFCLSAIAYAKGLKTYLYARNNFTYLNYAQFYLLRNPEKLLSEWFKQDPDATYDFINSRLFTEQALNAPLFLIAEGPLFAFELPYKRIENYLRTLVYYLDIENGSDSNQLLTAGGRDKLLPYLTHAYANTKIDIYSQFKFKARFDPDFLVKDTDLKDFCERAIICIARILVNAGKYEDACGPFFEMCSSQNIFYTK